MPDPVQVVVAKSDWETISAIVTAIAAMVALGIPFLADWLQRRARTEEWRHDEARRQAEEKDKIDSVLNMAQVAWLNQQTTKISLTDPQLQDMAPYVILRNQLEEAETTTKILEQLLLRNNFPLDVLKCAVAAITLTGKVARIMAGLTAKDDPQALADAKDELSIFLDLDGAQVSREVAKLRTKYGIADERT